MSKYANPITELVTRLAYHVGAVGRILYGFTWRDKPMENPDGMKDFPTVQLFLPEINETYRPVKNAVGQLVVLLTVSTARTGSVADLVLAAEKVADAIETNTSGEIDPCLSGSITKPFDIEISDGFATQASLNLQIRISMMPRAFSRGSRRI